MLHVCIHVSTMYTCVCSAAVMCLALPGVLNGTVTWNGLDPGDTATYTCDAGFQLDGLANRECGGDGVWTREESSCRGT